MGFLVEGAAGWRAGEEATGTSKMDSRSEERGSSWAVEMGRVATGATVCAAAAGEEEGRGREWYCG